MVFASGIRRLLALGAVCFVLIALAIAAKPAQADTRVINGGETRLEVSLTNFVKLLQAGLWIDPIAPAQIQFGSDPAAIFPVNTVGVADAGLQTATVPHQGGLRIKKASINRSIDATNVTLACLPLAGCRLLNTANNLLPNELAEIRGVTFTDDGSGTVTLSGGAYVTAVTALVLNTLFETTVFADGMVLGHINATFKY